MEKEAGTTEPPAGTSSRCLPCGRVPSRNSLLRGTENTLEAGRAATIWSRSSNTSRMSGHTSEDRTSVSTLFAQDSLAEACSICAKEQECGVLQCSLCLRQLYREQQLSLRSQQETDDAPTRGTHVYRIMTGRVDPNNNDSVQRIKAIVEEMSAWRVLESRVFMAADRSNVVVSIVKWASYADFKSAFQAGEIHRIFRSLATSYLSPPMVVGTGPPRWQYGLDPVEVSPHLRLVWFDGLAKRCRDTSGSRGHMQIGIALKQRLDQVASVDGVLAVECADRLVFVCGFSSAEVASPAMPAVESALLRFAQAGRPSGQLFQGGGFLCTYHTKLPWLAQPSGPAIEPYLVRNRNTSDSDASEKLDHTSSAGSGRARASRPLRWNQNNTLWTYPIMSTPSRRQEPSPTNQPRHPTATSQTSALASPMVLLRAVAVGGAAWLHRVRFTAGRPSHAVALALFLSAAAAALAFGRGRPWRLGSERLAPER